MFTFNECVFVGRGRSCQDSEFRPNLVNTLLFHLDKHAHKHTQKGNRRTSRCGLGWERFPFLFKPFSLFGSFWQLLPLPSHFGSSCWTLCHQCRESPLRDGWYHTWWLWPWLCLCCLPSPCALWCLHAGTSGWHRAPTAGQISAYTSYLWTYQ